MTRWKTRALLGTVVVLGVMQLIAVDRSNPPVEEEMPASPEVREVLRRACYDCHSNETVWPWYAHVAPVSFLVARDVNEGRRHLNFSTWNQRSERRRARAYEEIREQVDEGEMPLWFYVPLHPEAKLTAADQTLLHAWTVAQEATAPTADGP
ncbi:MAG TPA: heme-binding domain-containing protein [Trueperaceae bacterium]|nr:heme-binding domain-containing protein [Trueperaceae bacterium]